VAWKWKTHARQLPKISGLQFSILFLPPALCPQNRSSCWASRLLENQLLPLLCFRGQRRINTQTLLSVMVLLTSETTAMRVRTRTQISPAVILSHLSRYPCPSLRLYRSVLKFILYSTVTPLFASTYNAAPYLGHDRPRLDTTLVIC